MSIRFVCSYSAIGIGVKDYIRQKFSTNREDRLPHRKTLQTKKHFEKIFKSKGFKPAVYEVRMNVESDSRKVCRKMMHLHWNGEEVNILFIKPVRYYENYLFDFKCEECESLRGGLKED